MGSRTAILAASRNPLRAVRLPQLQLQRCACLPNVVQPNPPRHDPTNAYVRQLTTTTVAQAESIMMWLWTRNKAHGSSFTWTATTKMQREGGGRRRHGGGVPTCLFRGCGVVVGYGDRVASLSSGSPLRPFSSSSSYFPDKGLEILIDPKKGGSRNDRHQRRGPSSSSSTSSTIKFVDKMRMVAKGGQGGKGSLSLESVARKHRLRPDGGHGGNGGSVVLVATPNMTSLNGLRHHVVADKGGNGTSQNRNGKAGTNAVVQVPCGVLVRAARVAERDNNDDGVLGEASSSPDSTGVEFVMFDSEEDLVAFEQQQQQQRHDGDSLTELADLDTPGSYCVVAKGGKGGRGTARYSGYHGPLPDARVLIQDAQGGDGEVVHLELVLKLIGDVGLVGFPNAGKSSTLAALSRASPKVAPYPFTTLHPIVGVVEYHDGFRIRMADIPGLVEGASDGKGQGLDFLRHVERTKALLYVLDAADDPMHSLRVLVQEVTNYDSTLLSRPAIVAANKVDLLTADADNSTTASSSSSSEEQQFSQLSELLRQLQCAAHDLGIRCDDRVVAMSAGATGQGLRELSAMLRAVVEMVERSQHEAGPSESFGD